MIKGIVFDFDGTIIDTEMPEYEAWLEIFREYGGKLPFEVWVRVIGGTTTPFDPLEYLERQIGGDPGQSPDRKIDRQELRARQKSRHLDAVEKQPLRPGVREYLDQGKRQGLRIGLASSSSRAWVAGHLGRLGLLPYFDAFSTRDDVEFVKPDPALYRRVVAALGLEPREAVAIEDSVNGMLAAKRAGLRCVVAPCPLTRGLDFGSADIVLDSLEEMDLRTLLQRLDPIGP